MDVADVPPDHCWIKFSDSSKTDFLINPTGEKSSVRRSSLLRAAIRPRP
jgi:hypothetical protein